MWIVILNFFFLVLLASFFIYGLKHWSHLINEPDEEEPATDRFDTFNYRLPFWILIIGGGIYSLITDLFELLS